MITNFCNIDEKTDCKDRRPTPENFKDCMNKSTSEPWNNWAYENCMRKYNNKTFCFNKRDAFYKNDQNLCHCGGKIRYGHPHRDEWSYDIRGPTGNPLPNPSSSPIVCSGKYFKEHSNYNNDSYDPNHANQTYKWRGGKCQCDKAKYTAGVCQEL